MLVRDGDGLDAAMGWVAFMRSEGTVAFSKLASPSSTRRPAVSVLDAMIDQGII